jgi:dipeptidase D
MTIACAGGWRESITRKMEYAAPTMKEAFELSMEGFKGGHSGGLIHTGRGNPIRLITYFLGKLRDGKMDFELAALKGGSAYNALPQDSSAVILVNDGAALTAAVDEFRAEVKKYYKIFDPDIVIDLKPVAMPEQVWSAALTTAALDMGAILHHGVYAKMDTNPNQVASSGNLGIWKVNDKDEMEITTFIRCKSTFDEGQLAARHAVAARLCGFKVDVISHPGWDGSADGPLVKLICEVYNRLTGKEMTVSGTHAGLEPAVLGEKNPDMEMVCIGPQLYYLHSITEAADLNSLPGFARLLATVLAELAK